MKNVKIKEIKPSKRLTQLVDEIESLEIIRDSVYSKGSDSYCIYCFTSGYFNYNVNNKNMKNYGENILKNKYKLSDALDKGILHMLQDTFCDLLEEHIHLEAKQKLEQLLPHVKKWYPDAYISNENIVMFMGIVVPEIGTLLEFNSHLYAHCFQFNENEKFNHIWEDKDNLVIKEPNPFPQIERGYKLVANNSGGYMDYIVFDWDKKALIRYNRNSNSGYSAYSPSEGLEEISMIYDHKDKLIWTKEGEHDERD